MSASVTAALIVKNEAKFITGCLDTLVGVVDEIVIVDTGSSDATLELCRARGVEPVAFDWIGDFAAARNVALDLVKTDWTLYIDADERLKVDANGLPLRQMSDGDIIALTVNFRARIKATCYHEIRLFRNTKDIRFRGRIHETIHPDIHRLLRDGSKRMEHTSVRIDHLGYEGDLTHKHERNLPLLQKAVKDDPSRVYLHYTLGEALLGVGREAEGVRALENAVRLAEKFSDSPKQVNDGVLAGVKLIGHKLHNDPHGALKLAKQMAQRDHDLPLMRYLLARCTFAARSHDYDPQWVLGVMDELLAQDASSYSHPLIAFSQEYFRSLPWSLKGAVYAREKDFKRAAEAFQMASDLDPSAEEHRIKAAYFTMAAAKADA
ncbi:MAG: glycosyltransferase [Pseudomonadota bacterium]